MGVLKTLAAFLNPGRGDPAHRLADDGTAIGFAADAFTSEDKMDLHLVNLIRGRIDDLFGPYIHPEFAASGALNLPSSKTEPHSGSSCAEQRSIREAGVVSLMPASRKTPPESS
jgi:hypothetical protein